MELADISPTARATFEMWVIDTLIEKHERYMQWTRLLASADEHGPTMLTVDGQAVLFPFVLKRQEIVRATASADGQFLTLFLRVNGDEVAGAALLVCRRVPDAAFYVVIIWHDLYTATLAYVRD